jgi:hypothetical protein
MTKMTMPPHRQANQNPDELPPSSLFLRLQKRLWLGTFAVDAILLIGTGLYLPRALPVTFAGILMGLFYLWSLIYNAQHPRRGVQSVFSLIRMVVLAWLAVRLSHGRLAELALVMSGLLSYKLMLIVEYALQASPAFRRSKKRDDGKTDDSAEKPSSLVV